jgi:hypothetical protein
VAPPGIEIKAIEEIDPQTKKIPNLVDSAAYIATLLDPVADLKSRVTDLLTQEKIERERRGKQYDLRPLIEAINVSELDPDSQQIWMRLAARVGATGRPEEVLLALGIDPFNARVERQDIYLKAA